MDTQLIEQPKQTFSMALTESLNEVSSALPADFNITRFVQNGVALLNDNDQLKGYAKQYGTSAIKQGMMKAAYLGLDFMSKEAYLIPYGSQLNFMKDYRGDKKLVMRYSKRPILDIYAKLVREGDEFQDSIKDGKQSIDFKPLPFSNKPVVGAFAVCIFKDGGMLYETMSLEDLENVRKSSKMANGPTWKNHTGEMYKKTVLHRLCKHITIDFDTPEQYTYFNEDVAINTNGEQAEPQKASLNEILSEV